MNSEEIKIFLNRRREALERIVKSLIMSIILTGTVVAAAFLHEIICHAGSGEETVIFGSFPTNTILALFAFGAPFGWRFIHMIPRRSYIILPMILHIPWSIIKFLVAAAFGLPAMVILICRDVEKAVTSTYLLKEKESGRKECIGIRRISESNMI